jgi:hypothetical protein
MQSTSPVGMVCTSHARRVNSLRVYFPGVAIAAYYLWEPMENTANLIPCFVAHFPTLGV